MERIDADDCHGTEEVQNGRLKGKTDTDYFRFICPRCGPPRPTGKGNCLDVVACEQAPDDVRTLISRIRCSRCGLVDHFKIALAD